MISIRLEQPSDAAAVAQVNREAFGGPFEADLIGELRADGLFITSLVADVSGTAVGHVLFSALAVAVDGRNVPAASLAPLAVKPSWQRRGVGRRLVLAGLDDLRSKGVAAVLVVGDPEYYGRFGFSADLARKIASPYAGPAFMAVELERGALAGTSGTVRYPDAFGDG